MEQHTIILETPRREIPNEGLWIFVKALINSKLAIIEYFGVIIDNPSDYIDEEMQQKIDATTFIEINFESEDEIMYDSYSSDETLTLILDYIEQSENKEIIAYEKDITINL